jgi:hypothetical protein
MRSPNYPAINLERAETRVAELHEREHRNWVPIAVAFQIWNYKPNSSVAQQTLAALRAFGLVEIEGKGDARQIRISESGWRIVAGADDRTQLRQEAAARPAIYRELLDRAGEGGRLPSDETLRHYLVFDRSEGRFNERVAKEVLARFRETLSFSNLASNDTMGESSSNEDPEPKEAQQTPSIFDSIFPPPQPKGQDGTPKDKNVVAETKQEIFALDEGRVAVEWPSRISDASFTDIKDWLAILERKIGRCVQSGEGQPEEDS